MAERKAVIVRIEIPSLTQNVSNREISEDVERSLSINEGSGSVKKFTTAWLKPLTQWTSKQVAFRNRYMMLGRGERVAPVDDIPRIMNEYKEAATELEKVIDKLEQNYDVQLNTAQARMGKYYDREYFPTFQEIRAHLTNGFRLTILPLDDKPEFKDFGLLPEDEAVLRARAEASIKGDIIEGQKRLVEATKDLAYAALEKLEAPDGESFHKTRFTRVIEAAEKFASNALLDVNGASAFADDVRRTLTPIVDNIENVRENQVARQGAKDTVREMLDRIKGYC